MTEILINDHPGEQLLDETSPFWEEFHAREAEHEGRIAAGIATLLMRADLAGQYARRAATAGAKALAIREAREEAASR